MIVAACIHDVANDVYYPGLRHSELILEVARAIGEVPDHLTKGFIDDEGNFLDRRQAANVAYYCGQTETYTSHLTSEDIIP